MASMLMLVADMHEEKEFVSPYGDTGSVNEVRGPMGSFGPGHTITALYYM